MTTMRHAAAVCLFLVLGSASAIAVAATVDARIRPASTAPTVVVDAHGFAYIVSDPVEDDTAPPGPPPAPFNTASPRKPPEASPSNEPAKKPKSEKAKLEEPEGEAVVSDKPQGVYDPAYDAGPSCGSCSSIRGCSSQYGCDPCGSCSSFRLGGWIDQGISCVANRPADRYNGVVTFNDRDDEYQMNQLWLFAERPVDTGGCGWDIGGRIDFVYGTDARFTQAADGLEANWNQTEPFYQAALPQFYLDVGVNDWTIRMGHFFTIIGFEVVPAPENFFYSHAYTMQYGEPFTHTGVLFMRDIGSQWTFSAGVHRGNDQFDDTDGLDAMNYLGGFTWTNCPEDFSISFAISATEQGPGVPQMIYSLVSSWNITDKLTWVFQHDLGDTFDPDLRKRARWYGINEYLLYEINDCWSAGLRVEWFRDADGVRVHGLGVGNQNQGFQPNPPYFAGDFHEITAGLNWTPTCNLTVRPEARWDWYDPNRPAPRGDRPYDAGDRSGQFLFGCDLIYLF